MDRPGFTRLTAPGLAALIVILVIAASPVGAQAPAPGAPTPALQGNHLIAFVSILALFALAVLLTLFVYMYYIQQRFYDVVGSAARAGVALQATWVAPFVQQGASFGVEAAPGAAAMSITGPPSVVVGTLSPEFTLKDAPEGGAQAQWTATPPTAAALIPARGPKSKVFAAEAGVFTLSVTAGDQTVTAQVAATAPQPSRAAELPFIGGGYGAIVIAVVLLMMVTTLAVGGFLTSEATGTLFGGLLGYIFGSTRAQSAARQPERPPAPEQ
jgi:hypothetical protein